jgi:hypothetical protein
MYSSSAFAANTMFRSAVAAAFPLFTVQMFTKVNTMLYIRIVGFLMEYFAVGCQLGVDTSWDHRHHIDAMSISLLQIWRPHPCGKYIRSWYCKSHRNYIFARMF